MADCYLEYYPKGVNVPKVYPVIKKQTNIGNSTLCDIRLKNLPDADLQYALQIDKNGQASLSFKCTQSILFNGMNLDKDHRLKNGDEFEIGEKRFRFVQNAKNNRHSLAINFRPPSKIPVVTKSLTKMPTRRSLSVSENKKTIQNKRRTCSSAQLDQKRLNDSWESRPSAKTPSRERQSLRKMLFMKNQQPEPAAEETTSDSKSLGQKRKASTLSPVSTKKKTKPNPKTTKTHLSENFDGLDVMFQTPVNSPSKSPLGDVTNASMTDLFSSPDKPEHSPEDDVFHTPKEDVSLTEDQSMSKENSMKSSMKSVSLRSGTKGNDTSGLEMSKLSLTSYSFTEDDSITSDRSGMSGSIISSTPLKTLEVNTRISVNASNRPSPKTPDTGANAVFKTPSNMSVKKSVKSARKTPRIQPSVADLIDFNTPKEELKQKANESSSKRSLRSASKSRNISEVSDASPSAKSFYSNPKTPKSSTKKSLRNADKSQDVTSDSIISLRSAKKLSILNESVTKSPGTPAGTSSITEKIQNSHNKSRRSSYAIRQLIKDNTVSNDSIISVGTPAKQSAMQKTPIHETSADKSRRSSSRNANISPISMKDDSIANVDSSIKSLSGKKSRNTSAILDSSVESLPVQKDVSLRKSTNSKIASSSILDASNHNADSSYKSLRGNKSRNTSTKLDSSIESISAEKEKSLRTSINNKTTSILLENDSSVNVDTSYKSLRGNKSQNASAMLDSSVESIPAQNDRSLRKSTNSKNSSHLKDDSIVNVDISIQSLSGKKSRNASAMLDSSVETVPVENERSLRTSMSSKTSSHLVEDRSNAKADLSSKSLGGKKSRNTSTMLDSSIESTPAQKDRSLRKSTNNTNSSYLKDDSLSNVDISMKSLSGKKSQNASAMFDSSVESIPAEGERSLRNSTKSKISFNLIKDNSNVKADLSNKSRAMLDSSIESLSPRKDNRSLRKSTNSQIASTSIVDASNVIADSSYKSLRGNKSRNATAVLDSSIESLSAQNDRSLRKPTNSKNSSLLKDDSIVNVDISNKSLSGRKSRNTSANSSIESLHTKEDKSLRYSRSSGVSSNLKDNSIVDKDLSRKSLSGKKSADSSVEYISTERDRSLRRSVKSIASSSLIKVDSIVDLSNKSLSGKKSRNASTILDSSIESLPTEKERSLRNSINRTRTLNDSVSLKSADKTKNKSSMSIGSASKHSSVVNNSRNNINSSLNQSTRTTRGSDLTTVNFMEHNYAKTPETSKKYAELQQLSECSVFIDAKSVQKPTDETCLIEKTSKNASLSEVLTFSDDTPPQRTRRSNSNLDVSGVEYLFKTPVSLQKKSKSSQKKKLRSPVVCLTGVKKLFTSTPFNDLTDVTGVKQLLRSTKKAQKPPKNDLTDVRGVKVLLGSGRKKQNSPKNDLTRIVGLKRLYATPDKSQKTPKNDLSDVSGVKELFEDSKSEEIQESAAKTTRSRQKKTPKESAKKCDPAESSANEVSLKSEEHSNITTKTTRSRQKRITSDDDNQEPVRTRTRRGAAQKRTSSPIAEVEAPKRRRGAKKEETPVGTEVEDINTTTAVAAAKKGRPTRGNKAEEVAEKKSTRKQHNNENTNEAEEAPKEERPTRGKKTEEASEKKTTRRRRNNENISETEEAAEEMRPKKGNKTEEVAEKKTTRRRRQNEKMSETEEAAEKVKPTKESKTEEASEVRSTRRRNKNEPATEKEQTQTETVAKRNTRRKPVQSEEEVIKVEKKTRGGKKSDGNTRSSENEPNTETEKIQEEPTTRRNTRRKEVQFEEAVAKVEKKSTRGRKADKNTKGDEDTSDSHVEEASPRGRQTRANKRQLHEETKISTRSRDLKSPLTEKDDGKKRRKR